MLALVTLQRIRAVAAGNRVHGHRVHVASRAGELDDLLWHAILLSSASFKDDESMREWHEEIVTNDPTTAILSILLTAG